MIKPPVPSKLYVPVIDAYIDPSYEHLVKEIMNEIRDTRFIGRTHGKRATRNHGCAGPMCKKVGRDTKRARSAKLAKLEGKDYKLYPRCRYDELDPIIEHFMKLPVDNQLSLQTS